MFTHFTPTINSHSEGKKPMTPAKRAHTHTKALYQYPKLPQQNPKPKPQIDLAKRAHTQSTHTHTQAHLVADLTVDEARGADGGAGEKFWKFSAPLYSLHKSTVIGTFHDFCRHGRGSMEIPASLRAYR